MGWIAQWLRRGTRAPAASDAGAEEPADPFTELSNGELSAGLERGRFQIIDVRFPHEYEWRRLEAARLIPLPELESRLGEIDPNRDTVLICEHGMRSVQACLVLAANGFDPRRLYNLTHGMAAWDGPRAGRSAG